MYDNLLKTPLISLYLLYFLNAEERKYNMKIICYIILETT